MCPQSTDRNEKESFFYVFYSSHLGWFAVVVKKLVSQTEFMVVVNSMVNDFFINCSCHME